MDPNYFNRELTSYEADLYLEGVDQRRRDTWEASRMIVSAWCSEPDALPAFPWEKEKTMTMPTEEEFNDLKAWAEHNIKRESNG